MGCNSVILILYSVPFNKNGKEAAPHIQETVKRDHLEQIAERVRLYTNSAAELRSSHINTGPLRGKTEQLGLPMRDFGLGGKSPKQKGLQPIMQLANSLSWPPCSFR